MANCQDFEITVKNNTLGEIKMTKFEYKDGSNWKTENMLGVDGHQKIERYGWFTWKRDLEGIGNEDTQFRVTYKPHVGGTKWGDDRCHVTSVFRALPNEERTVTLTA